MCGGNFNRLFVANRLPMKELWTAGHHCHSLSSLTDSRPICLGNSYSVCDLEWTLLYLRTVGCAGDSDSAYCQITWVLVVALVVGSTGAWCGQSSRWCESTVSTVPRSRSLRSWRQSNRTTTEGIGSTVWTVKTRCFALTNKKPLMRGPVSASYIYSWRSHFHQKCIRMQDFASKNLKFSRGVLLCPNRGKGRPLLHPLLPRPFTGGGASAHDVGVQMRTPGLRKSATSPLQLHFAKK